MPLQQLSSKSVNNPSNLITIFLRKSLNQPLGRSNMTEPQESHTCQKIPSNALMANTSEKSTTTLLTYGKEEQTNGNGT